MDTHNTSWITHLEFFVILMTILGFAYNMNALNASANNRIDQTNCRIDQTNQRIEAVYVQILDIQKEIKQIYIDKK